MLFNSFQFAALLLATLLLVRATPARLHSGVLLAASLTFYAAWIPQYLLLLFATIGINYVLLVQIHRGRHARLALAASAVTTLGVLASYKYLAFFLETTMPALVPLLGGDVAIPRFVLPLGISFYSFQILGLAIDAARKPDASPPSLVRYALFVCFFPQLIAGPILRGRELLPQLARGGERSGPRSRRGLWLLCSGLVKKVVFADFLLSGFVDSTFAQAGNASIGFHWVAMYSFAFQIYFDFSGYTDMARGAACLLGFELPENFREPYLARNPTEFWRGWHITLTSWFRDYVYVPLALGAFGRRHLYAVLLATWGLVGLWHGAAWTFVLWGLYHGALLAAHRAARRWLVRIKPVSVAARAGWGLLCWLATFHLICAGLILFRAADLAQAGAYLSGLFAGGPGEVPLVALGIALASLGLHLAERSARNALPRWHAALAARPWSAGFEGFAIGSILAIVIACSGTGQAFIYFQF